MRPNKTFRERRSLRVWRIREMFSQLQHRRQRHHHPQAQPIMLHRLNADTNSAPRFQACSPNMRSRTSQQRKNRSKIENSRRALLRAFRVKKRLERADTNNKTHPLGGGPVGLQSTLQSSCVTTLNRFHSRVHKDSINIRISTSSIQRVNPRKRTWILELLHIIHTIIIIQTAIHRIAAIRIVIRLG